MSEIPGQNGDTQGPRTPYSEVPTALTEEWCLLHTPDELHAGIDYLSIMTGASPDEFEQLVLGTCAAVESGRSYIAKRGTPEGVSDYELLRTEKSVLNSDAHLVLARDIKHMFDMTVELEKGIYSGDAPQASAGWKAAFDRLAYGIAEPDPNRLQVGHVSFGGTYQTVTEKSVTALREELEAQYTTWLSSKGMVLVEALQARVFLSAGDTGGFDLVETMRDRLRALEGGPQAGTNRQEIIDDMSMRLHAFYERYLTLSPERAPIATLTRVRALHQELDSWIVRRTKTRSQAHALQDEVHATRYNRAKNESEKARERLKEEERQQAAAAAAERQQQLDQISEEHQRLAAPWLTTKGQLRKAGLFGTFSTLRGHGPQDTELFNAAESESVALVMLGGVRRVHQLCTEGTPDDLSPQEHVIDVLRQELLLQARYDNIVEPPEGQRTNGNIRYIGNVTDWMNDNWPTIRDLLEKTTEWSPRDLDAMTALFVAAESSQEAVTDTEQAGEPEVADTETAAEKVLRVLGQAGLAEKVSIVEVDRILEGPPHPRTQRNKKATEELSRLKENQADRILEHFQDREDIYLARLLDLINMMNDEAFHGEQPPTLSLVRTARQLTSAPRSKPFLALEFSYDGKKYVLFENLFGDHASILYPASDNVPWREAITMRREALAELGALRIPHPPTDTDHLEYTGEKHEDRILAALFQLSE